MHNKAISQTTILLIRFIYTYQCIKEHNRNHTRTTTPDIMWFTPSVGVTSTELRFIQLSIKTTVLICALSCRSLQSSKPRTQLQASAHTAADFLITQKPSAHTAAKVVHAHSWELTFSYKISLSFASIPFT